MGIPGASERDGSDAVPRVVGDVERVVVAAPADPLNPYAPPKTPTVDAPRSTVEPSAPWPLRGARWLALRLCAVFLTSLALIVVFWVGPLRTEDAAMVGIPALLVALGWVGLARDARWAPWPFVLLALSILIGPSARANEMALPLLASALFCAWTAVVRRRWRHGRTGGAAGRSA